MEDKEKELKKKELNKKINKKGISIWQEFKKFITKGNVLDLSVAVIMGNAFTAIVTAVTKILLSLCTWGVPGGLNGLITILPAASSSQQGVANIGQYFSKADLTDMTIQYAANSGASITADSSTFNEWKKSLTGLYTLHGEIYVYNSAAIIDWGSLINAVIAFFIIAFALFAILKIFTFLQNKKAKFQAKELERYYQRHPEARPIETKPEEKPDPVVALLTEIRDSLKKEEKSKSKGKK